MGGGLINRKLFVANCKKSADTDLSGVNSSEDIFKNLGLYDLASESNIASPHPHLTQEIQKSGKNFKVDKLRRPVSDDKPSVLTANSFIINPKSLNGGYHIYCEYSTLCWMRFLAVKELMHVYANIFDEDHNWSSRLPPLLMCVRSIHNAIPVIDHDLDKESSAFYLAIEYLLPWSERDTIAKVSTFAKAATERSGDFLLAKCFFVPEYIITHIHMKDSAIDGLNYLDISSKVNKELEAEEKALMV
jgi:hypothetical protein